MDSIFTNIVKGIVPAYKIAENKKHLAFLDIMPLKLGHTLVIPKKQFCRITKMKNNEFTSLMKFVHVLAKSIEKTILCNRVGISILGFDIPHVHVHIIPIDKENEMDLNKSRISCKKELLILISNTIKHFLNEK